MNISTCVYTVGHKLPVKVGLGSDGDNVTAEVFVCVCIMWETTRAVCVFRKLEVFTERKVLELHALCKG